MFAQKILSVSTTLEELNVQVENVLPLSRSEMPVKMDRELLNLTCAQRIATVMEPHSNVLLRLQKTLLEIIQSHAHQDLLVSDLQMEYILAKT